MMIVCFSNNNVTESVAEKIGPRANKRRKKEKERKVKRPICRRSCRRRRCKTPTRLGARTKESELFSLIHSGSRYSSDDVMLS